MLSTKIKRGLIEIHAFTPWQHVFNLSEQFCTSPRKINALLDFKRVVSEHEV